MNQSKLRCRCIVAVACSTDHHCVLWSCVRLHGKFSEERFVSIQHRNPLPGVAAELVPYSVCLHAQKSPWFAWQEAQDEGTNSLFNQSSNSTLFEYTKPNYQIYLCICTHPHTHTYTHIHMYRSCLHFCQCMCVCVGRAHLHTYIHTALRT